YPPLFRSEMAGGAAALDLALGEVPRLEPDQRADAAAGPGADLPEAPILEPPSLPPPAEGGLPVRLEPDPLDERGRQPGLQSGHARVHGGEEEARAGEERRGLGPVEDRAAQEPPATAPEEALRDHAPGGAG